MTTDCQNSSATGPQNVVRNQEGGSRLSTDFWVVSGIAGTNQPTLWLRQKNPSTATQGIIGTTERQAPLILGSPFRLIPLLDSILPVLLLWKFMTALGSFPSCFLARPVTKLWEPLESADLRFHLVAEAKAHELPSYNPLGQSQEPTCVRNGILVSTWPGLLPVWIAKSPQVPSLSAHPI